MTPPSGPAPLKIAVIGQGIAGMGAAWLLNQGHQVTCYEAEPRFGGHSHTVEAPGGDGPIPVDMGFIVYNEPNYPNLAALFRHLGVETAFTERYDFPTICVGVFLGAAISVALGVIADAQFERIDVHRVGQLVERRLDRE